MFLRGFPNKYDVGQLRELRVVLFVSVGNEKHVDLEVFDIKGF